MKSVLQVLLIGLVFVGLFYIIVQGSFLLVGPDYKKGDYTMTYKVYYPNNPRTYTIKNDYPIGVKSSRGTNWVEKTVKTPIFIKAYSGDIVFETSAPIEVVSYTFKEKN